MHALFTELVEVVSNKGPNLADACQAIGMLIERECTRRPVKGDDLGVQEVLGDKYARLKLSKEDIRLAIDQLIVYLGTTFSPLSTAVWAVRKSYESRVVPILVYVLQAAASDPEQHGVALNALHGIEDSGVTSTYKDEALAAIRQVASNGTDEIRREAKRYLEHYDRVVGE